MFDDMAGDAARCVEDAGGLCIVVIPAPAEFLIYLREQPDWDVGKVELAPIHSQAGLVSVTRGFFGTQNGAQMFENFAACLFTRRLEPRTTAFLRKREKVAIESVIEPRAGVRRIARVAEAVIETLRIRGDFLDMLLRDYTSIPEKTQKECATNQRKHVTAGELVVVLGQFARDGRANESRNTVILSGGEVFWSTF